MRRRARVAAAGCPTCGQACGYEPEQCRAITRVRERRARWDAEAEQHRAGTRVAPEPDGAFDTLPVWLGEWPTLAWDLELWTLGAATASTPPGPVRFAVPAGPSAGEPLILTDRQLRFLCWWYALRPDGTWVVRGGSMRHARGTGKSPLAGALGVMELVGPCRLAHWDEDGAPVGKRASLPYIAVAAVSEAQCENTMQYVRAWCGKGTVLALEYGLDPGQQIIHAPGSGGLAGGKLRVLTSSASTARGATPTLVIGDEVGEWTEANKGVRLRATLGDNAAKVSGGRVLECANSWRPGLGSVAETRWEAWELEQDTLVEGDRPWLMDVREAPPGTDWTDPDGPNGIRVAVALVYAEVPWITAEQLMPTIMDPAKPIQESQREFGNLRVSDLTTWVSRQGWDQCADPDALARVEAARRTHDPRRDLFGPSAAALDDDDEVVLFVDPSETDDATALVACRMTDGLIVPLWVHEPHALDPAGRPFGRVTPGAIDARVIAAFTRWTVVAFRSDVHPIEQLAQTEWHQRYHKALLLWSAHDAAVAYDMRSKGLEFAKACGLVAAEIEAGDLRHTGDKTLARHVANAQRAPYRTSEFIGVGKGDKARKIDACVSAIGARELRRIVLDSTEWRKHLKRKARGGRKAIVLT